MNNSLCHGKRRPEERECEHDADKIEPWMSSLYDIDYAQTSQNSKGEYCRDSFGSSRQSPSYDRQGYERDESQSYHDG